MQIQVPDELYRKLKQLADLQHVSLAEVLRRAGEREVAAADPALTTAAGGWLPPVPRDLGIRSDIAVEDWRFLANESGPDGATAA